MNKKFPNSFKLKKAFFTSLFGAFLAFIIGKVFDPLFEYLYTFFLTFGGSFVSYISDSTYQKISDGFSEQASMSLFYIAYVACIYFLSMQFSSIKPLRHYTDSLEDISQLDHLLDESVDDTSASIDQLEKAAEKLKMQIENNKRQIDELISPRKRIDTLMVIFVKIWIILLIVVLFFVYSRSVFVNEKIVAMTNNIEIVSPYISDIEYKQLKSDFHTIKCSYDYDELMQKLQHIAEMHSITLKK